MTNKSLDKTENALAALLGALAKLLIKLEITPDRLSQISRCSFVKAAAVLAQKRTSGRPHLAKIAALTGLSRAEVKRIVDKDYSVEMAATESQPRALRVLEAWRSCAPFSRNGKPKRLPISKGQSSFAALCRAHSGDIPHRVILAELERTSRIKLNKLRTTVSIKTSPKSKAASSQDSRALEYVASFLAAALDEKHLLVRRKQRVLTATSVPIPYVEQSISGKVNEMLDQMPQLFPKAEGKNRASVEVFALVARNIRSVA